MAIHSSSVVDLVPQYLLSKRILTNARARAQEKADREHLGAMIRDVDYVLEWLETGRNPHSRKGAERRYVSLWDPLWLEQYNSTRHGPNAAPAPNAGLSEAERQRIAEFMRGLSRRERECYLMHVAEGLSFAQIARVLGVARGTVQNHIRRARVKIYRAKEKSLFR